MSMKAPRPAWPGRRPSWSAFLVVLTIVILAFSLIPSAGFAAGLYSERFDTDAGGWRVRTSGFSPSAFSVAATNGYLRANVANYSGVGLDISTYYVSATGSAQTANFIGDYPSVGGQLIGFDMQAVNRLPSRMVFSLFGGGKYLDYFFTSAIAATGQWYSFRLSLQSETASAWQGDSDALGSIVTNVTEIYFEMTRSTSNSMTVLFDNIFLDRLPASTAAEPAQVTWSHLRTGEVYRVDAATDLAVSPVVWNLVTNFVATNSVFSLPLNATNEHAFFRMIMEW